jgi:hypothetical protein
VHTLKLEPAAYTSEPEHTWFAARATVQVAAEAEPCQPCRKQSSPCPLRHSTAWWGVDG